MISSDNELSPSDLEALSESSMISLEAFVADSDQLLELETLAYRFNIFEALGVVRNELRHSKFLSYFLNPSSNHGLKDIFLKKVLQAALKSAPQVSSLSMLDLHVSDMSKCDVSVEADNIDILIEDHANRVAVIIEHKVDSSQHSDQLSRYYSVTTERHPTYKIFGIYLTKSGENPGDNRYAPLAHASVCGLVNEILRQPHLSLDEPVRVALAQYTEMLGRHYMADERIQELCIKLYKRHKVAIDLIIDNIPDRRTLIGNKVRELIAQGPFVLDDGGTKYSRFIPKSLDLPFFLGAESWTSSGRIMLFELWNEPTAAFVIIQLGPGDQNKRSVIHTFARSKPDLFKTEKTLSKNWQRLYKFSILEAPDYELDYGDMLEKVSAKWEAFVDNDLPRLETALLELGSETS